MTALDTRFRRLAADKIAQYGMLVTLKVNTAAAYDPATGASVQTTKSSAAYALISDYSLQNSGAGFAAGLILSGDKKFIIAALDNSQLKPGDGIVLNNETYVIIIVRETWSGEQVSMYEAQGRK